MASEERSQRVTVTAACLGWFFSAVDTVLLILFQKQVAAALGVDPQAIRIAIGVGLLGSAFGGIMFAQLGDRLGRIRTLGWCVIVYSVATAGMAAAPNVAILMAFRFIAGVGTGGEWSVGFALIAEVWPRARRGTLGGIVSAMFNLGTFLAIAFYQSGLGWRGSFGAMVLPALGVVWLRRLVPESPVWIALQQARAAGTVDKNLEASMQRAPLVALLRSRLLGIVLKATLVFTLMNFAFYAFSTVFINYLQMDRAKGGLGLDSSGEAPYQIALNLGGMAGAVLAGLTSDVLGRRLAYSVFCVIGAAAYVFLFLLTSAGVGAGTSLLLIFFVICLSFGIGSVMGSLASELFPTHLRSTGPGFCQNLGKGVGGLLGPVVTGALLPKLGFAAVLAMPGFCLAALALLIWLLPDVSGREVKPVEGEAVRVS
jgi:MFS family permease